MTPKERLDSIVAYIELQDDITIARAHLASLEARARSTWRQISFDEQEGCFILSVPHGQYLVKISDHELAEIQPLRPIEEAIA